MLNNIALCFSSRKMSKKLWEESPYREKIDMPTPMQIINRPHPMDYYNVIGIIEQSDVASYYKFTSFLSCFDKFHCSRRERERENQGIITVQASSCSMWSILAFVWFSPPYYCLGVIWFDFSIVEGHCWMLITNIIIYVFLLE